MKNRNFLKNSIAILLPISMVIGVLLGTANKHVNSASAYTASSLPTTIVLDDTNEEAVRNYYSALNSLGIDEKKGNNLLKNLKPILIKDQKYYKYDNDNAIWQMYEIIDRDWKKSPAYEINGDYGTYNASTNTITGYEYGSNSNPKSNPYLHALYTNRDAENPKRAWGSHGDRSDAATIEREHIWPKSHGFDSGTVAGARGDPMHLWAADGTANGMHSNLFYGYVDKSETYNDAGNKHNILFGNLTGISKTLGSGKVFEPQDSDKGDIARACFYMVARYNNIAGADNDISGANPNLTLSNSLSENDRSGTSTATDAFSLGILNDLLEWNRLDPPDEFEIHRNNLLYTNYTKNRNPFIDFPEWADIAFGNSTSSANPTSDTVSLIGETKTVSSISINTNPTKTTYTEGEMFDPSGMKLNVTYSDNSTIIVSSGFTCSPNRALTTDDISVTVNYNGKSTSVSITVKESESGEDTPSGEKYSITFKTNTGDGSTALNSTNLMAQISTGSNYVSSVSDINKAYSGMSGIKMSSSEVSGNFTLNLASSISNSFVKSVTINVAKWKSESSDINVYLNDGSTPSISFNTDSASKGSVSLSKTKISSIKITSSKRAYICGLDIEMEANSINPTSISVSPSELNLEIGESTTLSATVLPSNATNKSVSWASSDSSVVSVSNTGSLRALKPGTVTITCTSSAVSTLSATCSVTVLEELELHHISIIGPTKLTYNQGEEFDQSGLVVTAHYYRGQVEVSTEDVTDEAEISGYNASEVGGQTITVSFGGKNETFNVQVNEVIEQNTLIFDYRSQGYSNGQAVSSLSVDGFTVSFIRNNGTQPAYYTTGNAVRLYKNNDIEVTGPYKIKKIVIETSLGSVELTPSTGTLNNGIWSGDPEDFVKLSKTTSDNLYITKIKVQYDPNQTASAPLSSITLSGYKTQFYKGDSFSTTGLVVTAHYTDGSTKVVNPTSVSTPNMTYNGDKTVTVTYTERGITETKTYSINVKNDSVVSISLSGNYKTSFILGESFDYTGLIVVATWESGKTTYPDVTNECTIKDYDMNTASEQNVTVIYGGKSATYAIEVINVVVKTYVATILPSDFTNASYSDNNKDHTIKAVNANNPEDTRNIVVTTNQVMLMSEVMQWQSNKGFIYNKSEIGNITSVLVNSSSGTFFTSFGDSAISEHKTANTTATSGKYFNVSVGGATGTTKSVVITFTVTEGGSEKELSSISVSGDYKTSFNVGDDFSFGGIVTATYSDESTEDVTESATFSGYDLSTATEQTVTVTYDGKTTTYSITVSSPVVPPTPVGGNVYTKISSLDDIEDGAKYIIGYEDGNTLKAMPNDFAKKMAPIELTIDSRKVIDTNNRCFITLESVIKGNTISACITNGTKYLNSSSGTDFAMGTDGQNWVITVDDNGEFLFSNGTRSLIYWAGTTNKFGNYAISNLSQDECNKVSLYKEVINVDNYSLVTDPTDLRTGDKIVIAAPNTYAGVTTYYSLSTNRNITSTIYGCEVDFNNNVVTPSDETELITVERNGDDISFKLSDGKYIASYGDGTAKINLVDSSSDSSARFTATANTDNSIKLISENTDHNYRRLKFNYSSGKLYYRCYTTDSGTGVDPMIFKYQPQVEADTWAKDFLAKTESCILTYWSSLASSYNELSAAAKQEIYSAVSDASTDMNYRAQAMARYEKTLSVKSADAFISERQVDSVRPLYLPIVAPKTDTILIVVFSILGVSAIGGYYFVKRKKEDRV